MQVLEPTPQQLALWTRPNWMLMLLGALLIVMGAVTAIGPGKATSLTLSRSGGETGAAEIRHKTLFADRRVVRIPLRYLQGAMVDAGRIGTRTSFYHLDLDVRDGLGGAMYFAWYGSRDRAEADAAVINAFVADKHAQFAQVTNDKRPLYFPIGGFIAAIGMTLLLWSSLGVKAIFDRPASRVTIQRRGLLGTNVDVIPFGDIREFHVAGITGDCQLYMELMSGRNVTLSSSSDWQNMIGPRKIRAIRLAEADRIRIFCRPDELDWVV